MESLIIIILFLLISNLGGGRIRRHMSSPQRQAQPMNTRARTVREPAAENNARANNTRNDRRNTRRPQTAPAEECSYCTGDIAVESSLTPHIGVATAPMDVDKPCVDVSALKKQWGLSDMQNAMLWQEILDKPLATRRRR